MAEPGSTVRVSGLPTDIEDNMLRDKLFIHFLRARNGGGEIYSVTIVKTTPASALITFEDSGVAQRVIQHSRHMLDVDGKKYKVTVKEHREILDPDKVILSLSATVDHSQLPGGIRALTSLHKSHPDIQINYNDTEEVCTLVGTYSKVQAALAQLFGHPESPNSTENKDSGEATTSDSKSVQITQRPHTQESEDRSRNRQKEKQEKVPISRPSDEYTSSSYGDLTPGGNSWEETGQTEGAALQLPGYLTTSEEDFSLIVDADMFQYLQKHCRREYQHILSQYGVDVVDMTNQGLTTLFLQVAAGVEGGRDQEHLKLARKAISRLYQENETKIRRDQILKSILSLRGGVQKGIEVLRARFPKLLLNEDEQNIYIVGSSSDVSEAKQFLLLDFSDVRSKKEDVASLLRYSTYDLSPDEQRVPLNISSTVDSLDERMDQLLGSEEDERRAEGARRYKLAARFKDSGLPALGSRPTDFSLRGLSSPSRQTRLGPMVAHDVLSETGGIPGESFSRALTQNTVGDILFKSGDPLSSPASMPNRTSSNSHLLDTRPKSFMSPLGTTQTGSLGSTPFPPAGSGSGLKRASSFSGTPQQKAPVKSQKSQDDSSKPTVRARGRSSSFSNPTGRDKREVHTAEMTLSIVLWKHIKEAYSTRVDDLTSDVQMKESSEGGGKVKVTLKGASSSKLSSCWQGLQTLVDSVNADFDLHEVHLSDLGITDKADETLQVCCAEVRSRFKKVTLQILEKSLVILGPERLCSQVAASLREVFSGDSTHLPGQQDLSGSSTSHQSQSTYLQMNENQQTSPRSNGNSQVVLENQTSRADGTDGSQERTANQRSDFSESELVNGSTSQTLVRKDPVVKVKVKIAGTVEMEGQRTKTHVSQLKTTAPTDKDTDLHKKETTLHFTQRDGVQQRPTEIQDTPEESRPGVGSICVCGKSEMLMKTKCGATMCSTCLDTVHIHCRVCHETELTRRGIKGRMSYSKLNITVPGHHKDPAIKITYIIPDGIQADDHPSPGEPFKGAVFEAYLPDCEKTKKLLPRLEKAFKQGLTFTVLVKDKGAMVTWDCIPHKTALYGGKSGNGYPDSSYLSRLSDVLTSNGIGEPPAKS